MIGLAFNLVFIIQATRIPAKLQAVSFEINGSSAVFTTAAVPILAKAKEPIPSMLFTVFSLVAILLMRSIGKLKKEAHQNERSLLSAIEVSGTDIHGNLSSIIVNNEVLKQKLIA